MKQKMQKTKMSIFSFVFLCKFLYKQVLFYCAASTKGFRKNLFYKSVLYFPIDHYEQVHAMNFEQGGLRDHP